MLGAPLWVDAESSREGIEQSRAELERRLLQLTHEADAMVLE